MGLAGSTYLRKPKTEKWSSNESNEKFIVGISSMQGWRITFEDAHNCILNFDEGTSLFGVYDGHMGHEVAQYTAEELPNFLKNLAAYKSGNIEEALTRAFLGFDATIPKKEVTARLQKIIDSTELGKIKEKSDEVKESDAKKADLAEKCRKDVTNICENTTIHIESEDNLKAGKSSDNTIASSKEIVTIDALPLTVKNSSSLNNVKVAADPPDNSSKASSEIKICSSDGSEHSSLCTPNNEVIKEINNFKQNDKVIQSEDKAKKVRRSITTTTQSIEKVPKRGQVKIVINKKVVRLEERPGYISGCTAVVAVLRNDELYVANAGDSRCIICRNGKAVNMSFDHKPLNKLEKKRVEKAGGSVKKNGRINGSLNLSRAIGDHVYKMNKKISNKEQIIIALPDIRTLTINPVDDEFMVLVCDGIIDILSNQKVVDFVKERLDKNKTPTQICEEMMDYCSSKYCWLTGSGGDNMTVLIVQFKQTILKFPATSNTTINSENKTDEKRNQRPKEIKTCSIC